ncbi:MAG: pyridoxamine 5'-phosphate oxidase [Psychrobacter sp.]|nr:pyridoxamine 5'-phosphate oxidase [Psychrobacter sp.]
MSKDFTDQRLSYEKGVLEADQLPSNPLELLQQWLDEATEQGAPEPYAMSLATCGNDNQPSVRIVLLREITDQGLIFYTNYDSDKGQDLAANPHAEVLFFWHEMQRQVRVRGLVSKIAEAKSQDYFHKRPHDSQLAACVSTPQSGEVASREVMEATFSELKQQYPHGSEVPKPEFWGGYELSVVEVEFWQGRANRMHDRIVFTQQSATRWSTKRLLP